MVNLAIHAPFTACLFYFAAVERGNILYGDPSFVFQDDLAKNNFKRESSFRTDLPYVYGTRTDL